MKERGEQTIAPQRRDAQETGVLNSNLASFFLGGGRTRGRMEKTPSTQKSGPKFRGKRGDSATSLFTGGGELLGEVKGKASKSCEV